MTTRARYTTLASFKRQQSVSETGDDVFINELIDDASTWIANHARGRVFVPYYGSRSFGSAAPDTQLPVSGYNWQTSVASKLLLDDDLLAVVSVTNGDSNNTALTSYGLLPRNSYPKDSIQLSSSGGESWQFSAYDSVVTVTGFWGWHDDYAHAWESASTLTGTLTASDTRAAVPGTAGYVVGDTIKYGNELGYVGSIMAGTLVIERGVNGSVAGTFGAGTAVTVYQQVPDIQKACNDLVKYWYMTRASQDSAQLIDIGVKLENKIPASIWDTVATYQRGGFAGI